MGEKKNTKTSAISFGYLKFLFITSLNHMVERCLLFSKLHRGCVTWDGSLFSDGLSDRNSTGQFWHFSLCISCTRQATECIRPEGILNSTASPHPFHALAFILRKTLRIPWDSLRSINREQRCQSQTKKKSWQDGYGLQNGSISSFALNRSITIELPEWIGNNSSVLYSEVGQKEKYTESRKNNKPVCYF